MQASGHETGEVLGVPGPTTTLAWESRQAVDLLTSISSCLIMYLEIASLGKDFSKYMVQLLSPWLE